MAKIRLNEEVRTYLVSYDFTHAKLLQAFKKIGVEVPKRGFSEPNFRNLKSPPTHRDAGVGEETFRIYCLVFQHEFGWSKRLGEFCHPDDLASLPPHVRKDDLSLGGPAPRVDPTSHTPMGSVVPASDATDDDQDKQVETHAPSAEVLLTTAPLKESENCVLAHSAQVSETQATVKRDPQRIVRLAVLGVMLVAAGWLFAQAFTRGVSSARTNLGESITTGPDSTLPATAESGLLPDELVANPPQPPSTTGKSVLAVLFPDTDPPLCIDDEPYALAPPCTIGELTPNDAVRELFALTQKCASSDESNLETTALMVIDTLERIKNGTQHIHSPMVYCSRGAILSLLNSPRAAVKAYDTALAIPELSNPVRMTILNGRATTYYSLFTREPSLEFLQHAYDSFHQLRSFEKLMTDEQKVTLYRSLGDLYIDVATRGITEPKTSILRAIEMWSSAAMHAEAAYATAKTNDQNQIEVNTLIRLRNLLTGASRSALFNAEVLALWRKAIRERIDWRPSVSLSSDEIVQNLLAFVEASLPWVGFTEGQVFHAHELDAIRQCRTVFESDIKGRLHSGIHPALHNWATLLELELAGIENLALVGKKVDVMKVEKRLEEELVLIHQLQTSAPEILKTKLDELRCRNLLCVTALPLLDGERRARANAQIAENIQSAIQSAKDIAIDCNGAVGALGNETLRLFYMSSSGLVHEDEIKRHADAVLEVLLPLKEAAPYKAFDLAASTSHLLQYVSELKEADAAAFEDYDCRLHSHLFDLPKPHAGLKGAHLSLVAEDVVDMQVMESRVADKLGQLAEFLEQQAQDFSNAAPAELIGEPEFVQPSIE